LELLRFLYALTFVISFKGCDPLDIISESFLPFSAQWRARNDPSSDAAGSRILLSCATKKSMSTIAAPTAAAQTGAAV
jgi:hypothetical protein